MTDPPRGTAGMGGQIGMIVTDLVVPVAGYYILRGFGVDQILALVLAGSPTVLVIAYRAILQRRLNALGIFVLIVLAGSVALSFITGSPRFLLAKEGWFTGAIGVVFLVSLRFKRPLALTFARTLIQPTPLAEKLNLHKWDEHWAHDRSFRRVWNVTTVLWGVGMIGDAVARVVMAYSLPVDVVPALAGVLWGVTFVVLQVAQQIYFTRVGLWARLSSDTEPDRYEEGVA